MDITRLEKVICEASARMALAQSRILPTLDSCIPGMIGPVERHMFNIHRRAVLLAYADAQTAVRLLLEAGKLIGQVEEGGPHV